MSAPLAIVAMSGGVDSSVAAVLLQRQGYQVQGLFMSNWEEDEEGYCTAAQDFQDARMVCERLDIALHKVSFAGAYRERVFAHFLAEYQAGRTPNPDILCNREIKFGVCFEHARRLGADLLATGHYARLEHTTAGPRLLKGRDPGKDQSYFLHGVGAAALARTLFPLGGLRKQEVRRLALEQALPVFDKKDSTGICFIGERPFAQFLQRYLPAQPGRIRTPEGRQVGEHRGLMYYTVGQRQGLGIGGRGDAAQLPWYVADKDVSANDLIVVQGHDHPALLRGQAQIEQLSWIGAAPPARRFRCAVKLRYRQQEQPCTVLLAARSGATVVFDRPQRAVTPGQYAVFYDGDVCLGGGVIQSASIPPTQGC